MFGGVFFVFYYKVEYKKLMTKYFFYIFIGDYYRIWNDMKSGEVRWSKKGDAVKHLHSNKQYE